MKPNDDLLGRFHAVLLESIRTDAPSYLAKPFTVAEIYQSLVPYRTHRDRLGMEMNGDYEDALLRLLAGEGDYLILESEPARNRIIRELEHRNPNTGIYREFAAAEVRLNPIRIEEGAPSPKSMSNRPATRDRSDGRETTSPGAKVVDPGPVPDISPEKPSGGASHAASDEAKKDAGTDAGIGAGSNADPAEKESTSKSSGDSFVTPMAWRTSTSSVERPSAISSCPGCGRGLPDRASLQFCPHCGTNVRVVPCGKCGEVLERDWKYCVACGSPSGG